MKNLILILLLCAATTGISQTQKTNSDNRTYSLNEVDEKPELEGTITFADYFKKHFKSPAKLAEPMKLTFTVEKNGLALNPKLPAGTDAAIVAEAKKVLKAAGKWKPGKKGGNPVRVNYAHTINN